MHLAVHFLIILNFAMSLARCQLTDLTFVFFYDQPLTMPKKLIGILIR